DMSQTSYLLLYPAIYFNNSLFHFNSNLCPPTGGYEPDELPAALPRDLDCKDTSFFKKAISFLKLNIFKVTFAF
ncbi:MAG: hypothetical protein Q8S41_13825, partial [Lutibacter sp.]|nr:hypothetical protein [Lutibacter sp.]